MTCYESILIFHPDLSDEELEKEAEAVRERLTAGGAEISDLEHWGKRRLAYAVRRQRYGYYVLYRYTAPAKVIRETESRLAISELVLKYLTVCCKLGEVTSSDLLRGERGRSEESEPTAETRPREPGRSRPPAESPVPEKAPPASEGAGEETTEPAAAETTKTPEPAAVETTEKPETGTEPETGA